MHRVHETEGHVWSPSCTCVRNIRVLCYSSSIYVWVLQLTTLYDPFDRTYCPKTEHVLELYQQNESRRATVFVRYNNNPCAHCLIRISTVRGAAAQFCGISPFICIANKQISPHPCPHMFEVDPYFVGKSSCQWRCERTQW